jgi:hypothetical protein
MAGRGEGAKRIEGMVHVVFVIRNLMGILAHRRGAPVLFFTAHWNLDSRIYCAGFF